jgi:hypothetical protein
MKDSIEWKEYHIKIYNPHWKPRMYTRPALGPTQPPIQWAPGVKWPGREADHSAPTSDGLK